MLLTHKCPNCGVLHEKEATPEPDHFCEGCDTGELPPSSEEIAAQFQRYRKLTAKAAEVLKRLKSNQKELEYWLAVMRERRKEKKPLWGINEELAHRIKEAKRVETQEE